MAASSPGRYAVHHFAKNIYEIAATDAEGNALPMLQGELSAWRIPAPGGYVRFTYTLFGDHADGTYAGIDNRKLHFNMPAGFVYAPQLPDRPVELSFDLSEHPDWEVATQLQRLGDGRFSAPDTYYFLDSPTIVGEIDWRRWTSTSGDRDYTIEIAMLHEGTDEELDQYQEWVARIVEEQKEIFGELPDFDFGRYTFLCGYNPWVRGDGMEHRNSTVCTSQGNLADHAERLIGTISHEFFHAWNVERLRPKSLEPFRFDRANVSDALWFAEGFTSYYDDLVLCRAGIRSPEDYVKGLNGVLNYVSNGPGRLHRGPAAMSCMAPFVDAAASIDRNNFENTFISYYSYGAVIGLVLDLSLRTRYKDVTLDDYMRHLWKNYGKPEIPYTLADLETALAEVTGDAAFAEQFFDRYIRDSQLPDLKKLFAGVGLELRLKNPGQALPRLSWQVSDGKARLLSRITETDPAYHIGLNQGDYLLSIDGQSVLEMEGDSFPFEVGRGYLLSFEQRGKVYSGEIIPVQNPAVELVLMEETGEAPSEEVLRRRARWLSGE